MGPCACCGGTAPGALMLGAGVPAPLLACCAELRWVCLLAFAAVGPTGCVATDAAQPSLQSSTPEFVPFLNLGLGSLPAGAPMGLWLAGEDPLPEDGNGGGAADACKQHQRSSSSRESFVWSETPLTSQ